MMTKKWKRKPHFHENYKDHRIEDLFLCNSCKKWYPWFCYTKGQYAIFGNSNKTYKLLNDEDDRGGHEWSCDNCIYDLLYKNGLIIIRDKFGKNILNKKNEKN